ncbi:hypothetical protein FKX85_15410 [Echinicola soli]|uniref:Uncharacterized protein n=1 Tax=Echinicola soli TaxID=2591634 RepID=A0A514CKK4_9BACT|nr:hypothetical protein [Echinicola soli]QDH80349.1 hypothetical protein FKX85_15410 [Echinicola soli]
MEVFIKMKHYTLFLIIVGIPFASSLLINTTYLAGADISENTMASINMSAMLIGMMMMYLWIWSCILYLSKILDQKKITPSSSFSLALLVSMVFGILAILYFHSGGLLAGESMDQHFNAIENSPLLSISIAIMLFISLSLLFISLNHLAFLLVMAERNHQPHKTEYFSEFIMALIFPIGVWFLQPRLNEVLTPKDLINK